MGERMMTIMIRRNMSHQIMMMIMTMVLILLIMMMVLEVIALILDYWLDLLAYFWGIWYRANGGCYPCTITDIFFYPSTDIKYFCFLQRMYEIHIAINFLDFVMFLWLCMCAVFCFCN